MNTIPSGEPAPGTPTATQVAPPASVPPEDRGRLSVDDRVIEKIAGYVVTFVPEAAAAPRRVLGVHIGRARPDDAASVQAQVRNGVASIQAAIAVRWPHSVQKVADEVRKRIRSEVTALTGVHVDNIDVEVVAMTRPESAERRVI